jgi:hypothetical protein
MSVLSGGLVFEYSQGVNDYGLVNITSATELHLRQDYAFLATEYAKLDKKLLSTANGTATSRKAPACDPSLISAGAFYNSWGLPARPDGVDDLIKNGLPKPNQGKIVTVSKTAMPATVYDYNGDEVKDLKLTILDQNDSNLPGLAGNYTPPTGTASAKGSGTRTSSTATATKSKGPGSSTGAAVSVSISSTTLTFGAFIASFFLL